MWYHCWPSFVIKWKYIIYCKIVLWSFNLGCLSRMFFRRDTVRLENNSMFPWILRSFSNDLFGKYLQCWLIQLESERSQLGKTHFMFYNKYSNTFILVIFLRIYLEHIKRHQRVSWKYIDTILSFVLICACLF